MEKNSCEEWTFQKYEDCRASYLNYCDIYKENMADSRNFHVVIDVANTHELFVRIWLNVVFIYFLFVVSNVFFLMFKHWFDIRTVSTHPSRFPIKVYHIRFLYNLCMYKFKMKRIRTILRNILNMGFHIMNSCCAVLISFSYFRKI